MRQIFYLLLFLSFTRLSAQSDFRFADSTAEWNVVESMYSSTPPHFFQYTINYRVDRDTAIEGREYQIITSNPYENSTPAYVRKDSTGKVYRFTFVTSEDLLIYDFGKQPGDTFSIYNSPLHFNPRIPCRIDSVGTIQLDRLRKIMFLKDSADLTLNDIWIEDIGSLLNPFLYPGALFKVYDAPTYQLLCYFEKDTRLYHNPNAPDTCFIQTPSGFGDIDETGIEVYINSGLVKILLPQPTNEPINFLLHNVAGSIVMQETISGQATTLTLNNLPKGLYLYGITATGTRLKSGKLIAE